jgi:mannose-6-phosphate isomerase-like protein (cupin superfamily)
MKLLRLRKRPIKVALQDASAPSGFVEDISTNRVQIALVTLDPEEATDFGLHYHKNKESLIMVLDGKGKARLDGRDIDLEPGMAVIVPPREKHFVYLGIKSADGKPLRLIDIGAPPEEGHVFADG